MVPSQRTPQITTVGVYGAESSSQPMATMVLLLPLPVQNCTSLGSMVTNWAEALNVSVSPKISVISFFTIV